MQGVVRSRQTPLMDQLKELVQTYPTLTSTQRAKILARLYDPIVKANLGEVGRLVTLGDDASRNEAGTLMRDLVSSLH